MSLMSKLLMISLLITATVQAKMSDNELKSFYKRFIISKPSIKINKIDVLEIVKIKEMPGWEAYLTVMNLEYQGKKLSAPQILFVNGDLATPVLMNRKTNINYAKELRPTVPNSLYDDSHLLFGNKNAKHKVLVFSDPQCPFCIEMVPGIMKAAKEHPDAIALYYYHFPLIRLHPVSAVLVRIMHVAQELGRKDVIEKMYTLKIDPRETDVDKIIKAVKDHTGFPVTKEQINDPKVLAVIKKDSKAAERLMVSGTPTVFVDSKWDKMRDKYKLLIK